MGCERAGVSSSSAPFPAISLLSLPVQRCGSPHRWRRAWHFLGGIRSACVCVCEERANMNKMEEEARDENDPGSSSSSSSSSPAAAAHLAPFHSLLLLLHHADILCGAFLRIRKRSGLTALCKLYPCCGPRRAVLCRIQYRNKLVVRSTPSDCLDTNPTLA